MAKAIQRVSEYQPPRQTSLLKPFIKALGLGSITRALMGNTRTLGFMFGQFSKRNRKDAAFLNTMTQMTLSPNVCQGGAKINTQVKLLLILMFGPFQVKMKNMYSINFEEL
ncbi:MAG: hypothetical protein IH631_01115 [Candidatus Thorarchaeota archaeon]|nr:hypothetical protein [Candidatus Thorarchaeota archaeon]